MRFQTATSKPDIYLLLGSPIEFTLSPLIHNSVFQHEQLNALYFAQPVTPENFGQAVVSMQKLNWCGANITIPYKQTVLKYLDEIDETAQKAGAVNTIVNKGRLIGYNTDVLGFKRSLPDDLNRDRSAVCLGAGGAALAVVVALADLGFSKINIINRSYQNTVSLIKKISPYYPKLELNGWKWQELTPDCLKNRELVVNCTPADFALPDFVHNDAMFQETRIVYDLRYGLKSNKLLKKAQLNQVEQVFDGLEMLIWQAAYSQKIWRGRLPDIALIKEALKQWG